MMKEESLNTGPASLIATSNGTTTSIPSRMDMVDINSPSGGMLQSQGQGRLAPLAPGEKTMARSSSVEVSGPQQLKTKPRKRKEAALNWLRDTLSLHSTDHSSIRGDLRSDANDCYGESSFQHKDDSLLAESKHSASTISTRETRPRSTRLEASFAALSETETSTEHQCRPQREVTLAASYLELGSQHTAPLKLITPDVPQPKKSETVFSTTKHVPEKPQMDRWQSTKPMSSALPQHPKGLPDASRQFANNNERLHSRSRSHRGSIKTNQVSSTSVSFDCSFPEDIHLRGGHMIKDKQVPRVPSPVPPRARMSIFRRAPPASSLSTQNEEVVFDRQPNPTYRGGPPAIPLAAPTHYGPLGSPPNSHPPVGMHSPVSPTRSDCDGHIPIHIRSVNRLGVSEPRMRSPRSNDVTTSTMVPNVDASYSPFSSSDSDYPYRQSRNSEYFRQQAGNGGQVAASLNSASRPTGTEASTHSKAPCPMVSIGTERLPLRGTEETTKAVAADYYRPVCCMGCNLDIFVIADAMLVTCPACTTIGPVDSDDTFEGQHVQKVGVGLGFTGETLFKIQKDLMMRGKAKTALAPLVTLTSYS